VPGFAIGKSILMRDVGLPDALAENAQFEEHDQARRNPDMGRKSRLNNRPGGLPRSVPVPIPFVRNPGWRFSFRLFWGIVVVGPCAISPRKPIRSRDAVSSSS
jgi:hypothetical protein